ncbi:MAG: ABC transporter permease [Alkalispirochaeta sp.]
MSNSKARLHLVASWAGFLVIILVWQGISTLGLVAPETFPGPVRVAESVVESLSVGRVLEHVGTSLFRVFSGFGIGLFAAVILGVMCGWYIDFGTILRTPIELLRPVPPLAWIPLAIMWLGVGESSKLFVIFLGAFFPIFTNTYKGMMTIEPNVIRAGQMVGLRGWRLLLKVVVPMTLPDIATGMRLGWSYSFGAMVAAEIIAANSGLGYMIMHGRELGLVGVIMFGIILIGTLNMLTDYVIQSLILKRFLRWHYVPEQK